uniref:Cytochrome c oxidase assembly protein COX16 homolog, mitochondrial n=1 Tax=Ditylenchus dipsaci TaxID=166011 RepID=A0A915ELD3_9BILA
MKALGEKVVAAMNRVNGEQFKAGSVLEVMYPASGLAIDYAMGKIKIPYSFAMELRPQPTILTNGFVLPSAEILPGSKECWTGIQVVLASQFERSSGMNEKPSVSSQQEANRKKRVAGQNYLSSNWRFFKHSVPFLVMMAGGTFVLYSAQKIRIDFRTVKTEMDRTGELKGELTKKGVGVQEKKPLDEIYKDLEKIDVDNWTNVRGPRSHEDNTEYIQSRDKKKQETENSKKSRAIASPSSEPLQKSSL